MLAFLVTVILFTPSSSFAHGPVSVCAPELEPQISLNARVYLRYLIEDGVVRPVAKVQSLLDLIRRTRQRDLLDPVLEKMGPAAVALPRVGDMMHLGENLKRLSRGYQSLRWRCARVSDDLRNNHAYAEAMIAHSEDVLRTLDRYLAERPGRDTAWVQSNIARVNDDITRFRVTCLDDLPPQSKGFWDALDRVLSP